MLDPCIQAELASAAPFSQGSPGAPWVLLLRDPSQPPSKWGLDASFSVLLGLGAPLNLPPLIQVPVSATNWLPWRCPWDRVEGGEGHGREGAGCSCRDDLPLLPVAVLGVRRHWLGVSLGRGLGGPSPTSFFPLAPTGDHPRGHRAPATKAV